jgi:hypothetical protein
MPQDAESTHHAAIDNVNIAGIQLEELDGKPFTMDQAIALAGANVARGAAYGLLYLGEQVSRLVDVLERGQ